MAEVTHVVNSVRNAVWDTGTMTWISLQQPVLNAGSVTIPGTVTVSGSTLTNIDAATAKVSLSVTSGSVSGVGNNTILTPAAGKKIRISYLSYNPALATEVAWRFGATGTLFLRNSAPAASIIAKDFGDMRYLEGAVDQVLILNLSVGVATIYNVLYTEV